MIFRDDERAVSEQIGAILLFGMLIVSMSVYQATAVPQQNGQTEFQHSTQIQADMQAVHDAVLRTAATGMPQSTSVAVGTDYRSRTFFVNPPNPSGTLRTTGNGTMGFGIQYAKATGPSSKFWNGDLHVAMSESLVYEPDYHQYQNAPKTVYEYPFVYNRFREADVPLTGQSLIEGRTITLVTLDGSHSISKQGTETVESEPLSVSTNTVAIHGTDDRPIVLYALTTLPESVWRSRLSDEFASGNVVDFRYYTNAQLRQSRQVYTLPSGRKIPVDDDQRAVAISLNSSRTYNLRMAKVGVGSGATVPKPRYAVPVGSRNVTVPEDGRAQVSVEVRDAYNNPVRGVKVNVTNGPDHGNVIGPKSVETDSDGRATFTYKPRNVNGTTNDSFTVGFDGPDDGHVSGSASNGTESVTYRVQITTDGSNGGTSQSGSGGNATGGGGSLSNLPLRVDDLSNRNPNDPKYVVSYDVSSLGDAFSHVQVEFEDTDNSAASKANSSHSPRGSLAYANGYGIGHHYQIVARAYATGRDGSEYVAAERTISDVADAQSPSNNSDLGDSSSAKLAAVSIEDHSDTQRNEVKYTVGYNVSNAGSFGKVQLALLSRSGDGGSDYVTRTVRTDHDVTLDASYGAGSKYKIVVLLYDKSGAVVDSKTVTDTADGN